MNFLSLSIRSSIQSPLHPPGSSNFGAERGEVNLSILSTISEINTFKNKYLILCQGSPNRDHWTSSGVHRYRSSPLLGSGDRKKSVALYSLLLALLVPVVLTFFCFARFGPPLLCCVLVLCSLLVSVRLRLESAFVSVVGRSGSDHLHTLTSTIPILARLPRCFVSSSLLHRIVLTATSYRSPLLVTLHHRRVLGGLTPRVGSIGGKGICRTSHPDSFPACVSSISL